MRRWLWGDGGLADAQTHVETREKERAKALLVRDVVTNGNCENVKAGLELAESVAKAETDRETNLNARGAAVAIVAGLILPIATALARPVFATPSNDWAGASRKAAEYLFLAALVFVASALVMAVVGVLRPTRGGQRKYAVGETVVNVWRQERGHIALATAAEIQIAALRLDRLLRTIPPWHYRNRSKAQWLRRAWMFLMLGIILIGSAAVIFLAKLSEEMTWEEPVVVIMVTLIVIWLLLRFDLVRAGSGGWRQGKQERERKDADEDAAGIVSLLDPSAPSATQTGLKLAAKLRTLQGLRDAGWLSSEEYEFIRRSKVIDST
jgi:hypothetical protein